MFEPKCPYCRKVLIKRPKTKTQCPHCKKYIFVRNGKALTEHDTQVIDTNKKFTTWYGIPLEKIEAERKNLEKKFGFKPNESDVRWRLYNRLIVHAKNHAERSRLYSDMAEQLNRENKSNFKLLELTAKNILKDIAREQDGIGGDIVEILTDPEACDSCRKLSETVYHIKTALKNPPIPNKNCANRWKNGERGRCRCIYQPVYPNIETDEDIEISAQKIVTQANKMGNSSARRRKSTAVKFLRDTKKVLRGIDKTIKFFSKIGKK